MFSKEQLSAASRDLMAQWNHAKQLRDPEAVKQLANEKGLSLVKGYSLEDTVFYVDRGGECLHKGTLEEAAQFIDSYTIVTLL